MKISKLKTVILVIAGAGITFFLLLLVFSSITIGLSVNKQCKKAKDKYQGDCVVALAQVVDDEQNSLKERKQAIWALGQLGDDRALPVLEEYYEGSGVECNHENKLCQYELQKAIKLIKSGFNPTALIWRNSLINF